ncbi:MAG TPA: hypothetical protein VFA41_17645 [Ktedonobacteraceae bacterium]|nr:hypothetical protein [Ktedonobacteraceae bacterium]
MCLSCGCGEPDNDHGDSRNITLKDIDAAAEAAGTTRDRVLQNIMGGTGSQQEQTHDATVASPSGNAGQSTSAALPANQPPERPGEKREPIGTESGTDWQESQQAGYTGRGGVQTPDQSQ